MITHRLDNTLFKSALEKRDWHLDIHGTWCSPPGKLLKEVEQDWSDAHIEAIVCSAQEAERLRSSGSQVEDMSRENDSGSLEREATLPEPRSKKILRRNK